MSKGHGDKDDMLKCSLPINGENKSQMVKTELPKVI